MNRWVTVVCLSGFAVLVTSCSQAPATVDTRDADIKALKDDVAQWLKDFAAKDVDKIVSHYTDDVIVANTGMTPVTGRDAAKGVAKEILADPAFAITFEAARVEVSKSGDIGYVEGPYKSTLSNPATKKPMDDKGTFIEVYKKQADGSWKSGFDFATSEVLALPAPPPNKK